MFSLKEIREEAGRFIEMYPQETAIIFEDILGPTKTPTGKRLPRKYAWWQASDVPKLNQELRDNLVVVEVVVSGGTIPGN